MNNNQTLSERLARARSLHAHGWILKEDANDPEFMVKFHHDQAERAEQRTAELQAKLAETEIEVAAKEERHKIDARRAAEERANQALELLCRDGTIAAADCGALFAQFVRDPEAISFFMERRRSAGGRL